MSVVILDSRIQLWGCVPDPSFVDSAIIVEKLSEYLTYKSTYEGAKKTEDIPDFQERIYAEISLEL